MKLGIWLVRNEAETLGELLHQHLHGVLIRPWLKEQKSQKEQFQEQFSQYDQWILIMTTGIASRFLQGLPQDKHSDPAVVVLDEGNRYAISLLSGHEGGANALAYQVANLTGALPIITTATETLKPLIIGIGCRKGVSQERIQEAISTELQKLKRNLDEIREIATIDVKEKEAGLLEWCDSHKIPLRIIKSELIRKRPWVTKPSDWVQQNIGVDGVCEPCALLASIRGELILKKTAHNGVTVAIVEDSPSY